MGKKVCILTTVHPPFDTRIFHKEAETLASAGYAVTLIVQHDRDEVVSGVRIKTLPKPRNRFTRIFGLAWRAFRLALASGPGLKRGLCCEALGSLCILHWAITRAEVRRER